MNGDGFGDDTPEDAWDLGDPVDVCLDNLARRVVILQRLQVLRGPHGDRLEYIRRDLLALAFRERAD